VNAKSYTIFWGTTPSVKDGRTTVTTPAGTATGLKPNTMYFFRVQANPTKNPVGDPFASLVRTTARSAPTPAKPVPPKKTTVPGKPSTKTPGK
jgi:phosphodiesterase/alkaline phosphatase D-like protein